MKNKCVSESDSTKEIIHDNIKVHQVYI